MDLASFGGFDRFTLYAGAAAAVGWARTQVLRYSLYALQGTMLVPGATVEAGLRIQVGKGVLVLELRHNEALALTGGMKHVAQSVLSAAAATGGFAVSF
jgi:hypothetical protein